MPHEDLDTLGKALIEVREIDGVLTGKFDSDAARQLWWVYGSEAHRANTGTAAFWLDGKGWLTKYEIAIFVKGDQPRHGEPPGPPIMIDHVITKTVTLGGIGMTKVEIPAAAKAALE